MRLCAVAGAAAAFASLASVGAATAGTGSLDLQDAAITVFSSKPPDYLVGYSTAGAGDVNGDGLPDLLIGAPSSGHNHRRESGSAYVVFGSPAFAPRSPLPSLGDGGFRIDGAPPAVKIDTRDILGDDAGALTDSAGLTVSAAGDVNGDGLADVAVGAPSASPRKRVSAGAVYVVYGKKTSDRVDLERLGDGGYRIDGSRRSAQAGSAVASAGDVNGDGRGDLLVGNWPAALGGTDGAYLVFGAARTGSVDLAHLGPDGFTFDAGKRTVGLWVDGLGDVNADGLADMVIAGPAVKSSKGGRAYVVYGRAAPGTVKLATVGRDGGGYRISGGGDAGYPVSGPGDVNGDGRPDVLVGDAGGFHVLFSDGTSAPVNLARRATRAREMLVRDSDGVSAAGSGDANGDGLADILLADSFAGLGCHLGAGAAYVIYGRAQPGRVSVRDLGASGYGLAGSLRDEHAGDAAWVGDVDSDGATDLLVGGYGALPSGRAYLVSGRRGPVPVQPRGRCFSVAAPEERLGHVLRTGRLRLSVEWRSYGHMFLDAYVRGHGRVAVGLVHFRHPGTKRVTLRFSRKGRRILAKTRGRVRLRIVAGVEFESVGHASIVLRR
jgi:hypothetical protein